MSTEERKLLVAVVKGLEPLESVLAGFVELDLPGATVLESRGLAQIVATEIPVFSGFRDMFERGTEQSYTILSVLPDDRVEEVLALLRDVCGDFREPGSGIVFTLPIERFLGPEGEA